MIQPHVKRCYLTLPEAFTNVPAMMAKSQSRPKQQIGARIDQNLVTEIRVLAARQRRRFNELVDEALQDLLKKYRERKREGR